LKLHLAWRIKKNAARQAKISDLENGKVEARATDLIYLSMVLENPILNFFPTWSLENIFSEDLPIELQNLLLHARKLADEDIKKINVQVIALAEPSSCDED
jgi:transcriptional regulator with XRE-family HTH domain